MAFINTLFNLWPHGDEKIAGLRDGIAASAPVVFPKWGITDNLLIAHVMAQISHECGAGHDVVESLNYSAQRMTEVWPGRFPTIAVALPYAHNERLLGNKTYNGRMGNVLGSNDGFNFRGRGACQPTGRDGYEALRKALLAKDVVLDVVNHPDLVNDPAHFLECGVADFVVCGCLPYAKKDDVVDVSAMLNVGHIVKPSKIIGLAEREHWLARWKAALH